MQTRARTALRAWDIAIAVVAIIAVVAAGCTSSSDDTSDEVETTTTTVAATAQHTDVVVEVVGALVALRDRLINVRRSRRQ